VIATIVSSLVWILNQLATGHKMVNLESEITGIRKMLMWKLGNHEDIQKVPNGKIPFMVIIRASTDLGYFFLLGMQCRAMQRHAV